jgi:hypothetical protein
MGKSHPVNPPLLRVGVGRLHLLGVLLEDIGHAAQEFSRAAGLALEARVGCNFLNRPLTGRKQPPKVASRPGVLSFLDS